MKSASEETSYISDLLTASSLTTEHPTPNLATTHYVINPIIFDKLEAKFASSADYDEIASLDRRILFDSVNKVLIYSIDFAFDFTVHAGENREQ